MPLALATATVLSLATILLLAQPKAAGRIDRDRLRRSVIAALVAMAPTG